MILFSCYSYKNLQFILLFLICSVFITVNAQTEYLVKYDDGSYGDESMGDVFDDTDGKTDDDFGDYSQLIGPGVAAAGILTAKFTTPSWFPSENARQSLMQKKGILKGPFGWTYSDLGANHLRLANANSAFYRTVMNTILFGIGHEALETSYKQVIWDRKTLSGGTVNMGDDEVDYYLPDARAFIFAQTNGEADKSICDCYSSQYETGFLYTQCMKRIAFIEFSVRRLEEMDTLADNLLYKMETSRAHAAVFDYYTMLGHLTKYYVKLKTFCNEDTRLYYEKMYMASDSVIGIISDDTYSLEGGEESVTTDP